MKARKGRGREGGREKEEQIQRCYIQAEEQTRRMKQKMCGAEDYSYKLEPSGTVALAALSFECTNTQRDLSFK